MDGAMTKAPLGGETHRSQSNRPRQVRRHAQRAHRRHRPAHRIVGAGATRTDFTLTEATIQRIPIYRPTPASAPPQGLWLDTAYDYQEVRDLRVAFGFTAHLCGGSEAAQAITHAVGYRARR